VVQDANIHTDVVTELEQRMAASETGLLAEVRRARDAAEERLREVDAERRMLQESLLQMKESLLQMKPELLSLQQEGNAGQGRCGLVVQDHGVTRGAVTQLQAQVDMLDQRMSMAGDGRAAELQRARDTAEERLREVDAERRMLQESLLQMKPELLSFQQERNGRGDGHEVGTQLQAQVNVLGQQMSTAGLEMAAVRGEIMAMRGEMQTGLFLYRTAGPWRLPPDIPPEAPSAPGV